MLYDFSKKKQKNRLVAIKNPTLINALWHSLIGPIYK